MPIDIHGESLVPLVEAPAHIPGRPHLSTIHRWIQRGVRGLKLDTVVVGTRRFTSHEAIERFITGTTLAASTGHDVAPTPRQREAAISAAERDLAR